MKTITNPGKFIQPILLMLLMCVSLSSVAETYTYDSAGRLTGVTYADGSSMNYLYDANGNRLGRTVSLSPSDTTPPVITLNGANPLQVLQGSVFTDPGATAVDAVDGNRPVTVTGAVNTNIPGSVTLTYKASDLSGNMAQLTRSVQVLASSNASLPGGGQLQINLPLNSNFNVPVSIGAVTNAPAGIAAGFGAISFSISGPAPGFSATVTLIFPSPLPAPLIVYKVDNANVYTVIPAALWTQTGPNTLQLTLSDGGPFDLDGVADGVIIDPIAVGSAQNPAPASPPQPIPSMSPTALLLLILLLAVMVTLTWRNSRRMR